LVQLLGVNVDVGVNTRGRELTSTRLRAS